MLPVPIGSSRNSNFEADVLETDSHWKFLPMIFVISIFELTKTARSAFKVPGVGSIDLLINVTRLLVSPNSKLILLILIGKVILIAVRISYLVPKSFLNLTNK